MDIEAYQNNKDEIYTLQNEIKKRESSIRDFEKQVKCKILKVCKGWNIWNDNKINFDFKKYYVNVKFSNNSFSSFTCMVHYEHIDKIKQWDDLIKYRIGIKKVDS